MQWRLGRGAKGAIQGSQAAKGAIQGVRLLCNNPGRAHYPDYVPYLDLEPCDFVFREQAATRPRLDQDTTAP